MALREEELRRLQEHRDDVGVRELVGDALVRRLRVWGIAALVRLRRLEIGDLRKFRLRRVARDASKLTGQLFRDQRSGAPDSSRFQAIAC